MRVVVTEASSPVAYHFLPLLCSGDILGPQTAIELVLCDREPMLDEVRGVAMEIQDCLFPAVSCITVSSDFFDAVRSADIAVILQRPSCGHYGLRKVEITHTALPHIDFQWLDASMRLCRQDNETHTTNGVLATAVAIATHIQCMVQNNAKTTSIDEALVSTNMHLHSNPWHNTQEPAIYTGIETDVENGNLLHRYSSHSLGMDEVPVQGYQVDDVNPKSHYMDEGPMFERMSTGWGNHHVLLVHVQETYLGNTVSKVGEKRQNGSTSSMPLYLSRL